MSEKSSMNWRFQTSRTWLSFTEALKKFFGMNACIKKKGLLCLQLVI